MLAIILWTLLAVSLIYLYKLIKKPTEFWKNKPVKYIPSWPIVGNYGNLAFRKRAFVHVIRDLYNHFPNERYVGVTIYFSPSLMIRDLDLIKTMAIKDFDHFTDHCGSDLESVDPLMCKTLFLLTGQRWKDMRDTLSPAFTSAKMKAMFGFMSECAQHFLDHLKGQQVVEVEMKQLICRYATDVIATCAYGTEVNSFKNKRNEFFMTGVEAMNFIGWKGVKFMILQTWPKLLKFFGVPIMGPKETRFFRTLTDQTIAYRAKSKLIRPDMIHLLMEAQKGELKTVQDDNVNEIGFAGQQSPIISEKTSPWKLTNEDIASQVFIFFLGGFDTASTVMSFLTYELAMNVDVQKRLQEEVDGVLANCKNKSGLLPNYDAIAQMTYLDMVICESLRKWTPAVQIDRLCVKDYTIQPVLAHEEPLTIKKGSLILFPITAIHHDQKYFPDPYKFDPERFNDANKKNIVPYSYMPFGIGPRFCLGNRFAILEMKVLIFYLLSEFDISFTTKSVVPIVLDPSDLASKVLGGFNVGLNLRKKSTFNFEASL